METALIELACDDYDLSGTLSSGQAFRWKYIDGGWEGVIGGRWVRLTESPAVIRATTAGTPAPDSVWLEHYLQVKVDLSVVIASFPPDDVMPEAVAACPGLRLLRQDKWECLASFILSSTKQIVQIQEIVGLLCERFGPEIAGPANRPTQYAFPTAERLAACSEAELRACKMGFRAPYLLETARAVAGGFDLETLTRADVDEARDRLMEFPGVGRKIADCVLLFSCGFQTAFPVDVWIMKALQKLYFPKRRATLKRLHRFSQTHFGPNAGYAQQYLFHYVRIRSQHHAKD